MSSNPICGACGYQWVGNELHYCNDSMIKAHTNNLLLQVLGSLARIEKKLSNSEENGPKETR